MDEEIVDSSDDSDNSDLDGSVQDDEYTGRRASATILIKMCEVTINSR